MTVTHTTTMALNAPHRRRRPLARLRLDISAAPVEPFEIRRTLVLLQSERVLECPDTSEAALELVSGLSPAEVRAIDVITRLHACVRFRVGDYQPVIAEVLDLLPQLDVRLAGHTVAADPAPIRPTCRVAVVGGAPRTVWSPAVLCVWPNLRLLLDADRVLRPIAEDVRPSVVDRLATDAAEGPTPSAPPAAYGLRVELFPPTDGHPVPHRLQILALDGERQVALDPPLILAQLDRVVRGLTSEEREVLRARGDYLVAVEWEDLELARQAGGEFLEVVPRLASAEVIVEGKSVRTCREPVYPWFGSDYDQPEDEASWSPPPPRIHWNTWPAAIVDDEGRLRSVSIEVPRDRVWAYFEAAERAREAAATVAESSVGWDSATGGWSVVRVRRDLPDSEWAYAASADVDSRRSLMWIQPGFAVGTDHDAA